MDADIIVIGGGAAGLAAARSLARRPIRVMLLEARDRVGGRVWSHPIARSTTPAELGAEFIHGPAPESTALLRDAGIATVAVDGEGWARPTGGDLRREARGFAEAASIFDATLALAGDESVDEFLRRFDRDPAARDVAAAARAFVEGFDAADPARASARAIAQEWRSGVDSTVARPIGGYGQLFEQMRDDCVAAGVRLCLSTTVRRVSWRPGCVVVDSVDFEGTPRTITARNAVVTLPAGVLRRHGDESAVAFDPELPPEKCDALGHIETGHVVKVTLCFRSAFWELIDGERYRDGAFFRNEAGPFPAYWTQLPVRSRLVVAWAGGPKAIAIEGLSNTERIERALDGFGRLLGEPKLASSAFEFGITHDWSRDPLACGAYSYVTVGGEESRAQLARSLDRTIFFAGEATATAGEAGTVNGAFETGRRAAMEIVNA
ncbi:MAG: NAD(P)/FAD-dependent oxidoreductase [Candidatus Cybelea sp.]